MANKYAAVRKRWRPIDTERDLLAIWRGERFEDPDTVGDALRVYELAIRVDGWETVKGWARKALAAGQVLNAQVVELAMRAIEQQDEAFFGEITEQLLSTAPPAYFRFWHTLFSARHTNFGERLFRRQLAELSDFHVVKYRRWLRKILRKLRFRCKTPQETAIGAITFAMYKKYDAKAYPSQVFADYIASHDAARTRKVVEQTGKPVSARKQMEQYTPKAAKLGIWSISEGIRTSLKLPRTLDYLAAMAPRMSDGELLRGLRAFDQNLNTADHKKAAENVVQLAEYLTTRLAHLEVSLEEWTKIYPYMSSPTLQRVFEQLIDDKLAPHVEGLAGLEVCPVVVAPQTLEGRAHRDALLTGYALYLGDPRATVFLADAKARALCHPTKLWPYGYSADPAAEHWMAEPDRPHRVLYQLVRETFVAAALRRTSTEVAADVYLRCLRYHLQRRVVVDGGARASDVPVLFFAQEPAAELHKALSAHLSFFSSSVLLLFGQRWERPLPDEGIAHLTVETDLSGTLAAIKEAIAAQGARRETFEARRADVDAELRHLLLGAPPWLQIEHVVQGPWRTP